MNFDYVMRKDEEARTDGAKASKASEQRWIIKMCQSRFRVLEASFCIAFRDQGFKFLHPARGRKQKRSVNIKAFTIDSNTQDTQTKNT